MNALQFDLLVRQLVRGGSRRGLLRLVVSLPLAGSFRAWLSPDDIAARKKRKKKRRRKKKKCGKTGASPVKGKCCTGSVNVHGRCRNCDVCASGCAFEAVQEAIDAAVDGATIALCPGTYVGSFSIERDLTLIGAGDGGGSGDTILRGTGAARVVTTNSANIVLQNLRITGGGDDDGSGMANPSATLALIGCTVTGNMAGPNFFGGGIRNDGELTLTGSVISANQSRHGGGIFNFGKLNLVESEISGNTADEESGVGGGIYNSGTVTFDAASRVTGNTASDMFGGGGIFNSGGTVTLASTQNVTSNSPNNCAGDDVALCSG